MTGLFTHPDGCLRGPAPSGLFSAVFVGRCGHTKVAGAEFVIAADSLGEAAEYAGTYLTPPQMVLVSVSEYVPGCPAGCA
jgi:hypothetical protein